MNTYSVPPPRRPGALFAKALLSIGQIKQQERLAHFPCHEGSEPSLIGHASEEPVALPQLPA
jgi:hypothetical protein